MITKDELYCLKSLIKFSFFEEYLCCVKLQDRIKFFNARVMKKAAIMRSNNDEKMVEFELMIRSNLRHPFLVNQVCAFQDYDNLYYITESAPVCLFDTKIFPKTFSIMQARFYISEIYLCLKYMHSKKQIYTFLCPDNVLVGVDGHIKIDYCFCNCLETKNTGIVQNIEYTSLDYILNKKFSFLSDYWSMGVLLYKMIYGYTPFISNTLEETVDKMINEPVSFSKIIDSDLTDFISMLLDVNNFENELLCEDFEKRIEDHPFLKDIDWNKIEQKTISSPFNIKIPSYDLSSFPKLSTLYTSDLRVGSKDGYGKTFFYYNTVHFLIKK